MNFLTRWWNRRKLKQIELLRQIEPPKPIWRMCDNEGCTNKAIAFCQTHSTYVCEEHIKIYGFVHSGRCHFLSVRAAADAVTGKVR